MKHLRLSVFFIVLTICCTPIDYNHRTDKTDKEVLDRIVKNNLDDIDYDLILRLYIENNYRLPNSKRDLISYYKQRYQDLHYINDKEVIRLLRKQEMKVFVLNDTCYLYNLLNGGYSQVIGTPPLWYQWPFGSDNYKYNYVYESPNYYGKNGKHLNRMIGTEVEGYNEAISNMLAQAESIIINPDSETRLARQWFFLEYTDGNLRLLDNCYYSNINFTQISKDGVTLSTHLTIDEVYKLCGKSMNRQEDILAAFMNNNPEIKRIIFLGCFICD